MAFFGGGISRRKSGAPVAESQVQSSFQNIGSAADSSFQRSSATCTSTNPFARLQQPQQAPHQTYSLVDWSNRLVTTAMGLELRERLSATQDAMSELGTAEFDVVASAASSLKNAVDPHHAEVTKVELRGSSIRSEQLLMVARALEGNSSVLELGFSGVIIGSIGSAAIAEMLKASYFQDNCC